MSGIGEFSISHGYGRGVLSGWRIMEEDRLELIRLSEEERHIKVATTPKSTGRKPSPKKGKKPCKRTIPMF